MSHWPPHSAQSCHCSMYCYFLLFIKIKLLTLLSFVSTVLIFYLSLPVGDDGLATYCTMAEKAATFYTFHKEAWSLRELETHASGFYFHSCLGYIQFISSYINVVVALSGDPEKKLFLMNVVYIKKCINV